MADSRRLVDSDERTYRYAALDAAAEREAHRQTGGGSPAPSRLPARGALTSRASNPRGDGDPGIGVYSREAHLVSRTSSASRARHGDREFGRRPDPDARRARTGPDYRSAAERPLIAGVDNAALMRKLAEAAEKYGEVTGLRPDALAGAIGNALADLEDARDKFGKGRGGGDGGVGGGSGGAGGGAMLGGVEELLGRGSRGGPPSAGGGKRGPDVSGGSGWEGAPQRGSAMDPKSPTGKPFGSGRGGSAGDSFGDANGYAQAGWGGLEQGFSAGRGGPSRAELAGSLWKGLHPGRDASDPKPGEPPPAEPTPPKKKNPDGADAGIELADDKTPHGASKGPAQPGPTGTPSAGGLAAGIAGAVAGAIAGAIVGSKVPVIGEVAAVVLGLGGAVGGFYGGQAAWAKWGWRPPEDGHRSFFMPADDSTGPVIPRSRPDQGGRLYLPADDSTGPVIPRSRAYLTSRTTGPTEHGVGRSSPDAPGAWLYKPNPDDPSPGNPNSRTTYALHEPRPSAWCSSGASSVA